MTRQVQPITLIICEIMTNAMKYAHPAGVPKVHMKVVCRFPLPDGSLFVSVSDDGVGLPEGFEHRQGRRHRLSGDPERWRRKLAPHLEVHAPTIWASPEITVPCALVAKRPGHA